MRYKEHILNVLIDSYERSSLSREENVVAVHISFPINKKTLPVYFDENSLAYEEIHGVANYLEELGYTYSVWKLGKKNHILQKIVLQDEKVDEIYEYLGRTPQKKMEQEQIQTLKKLNEEYKTPIAGKFICWLIERLEEGKTVKEFLELKDSKETQMLIRAIAAMESNHEEIYIREFSVRCFGDSKILEKRVGLLGKIFRRFSDDLAELDNESILAEYGIYRTPNYVYVKGNACFCIGAPNPHKINLADFRQGIGLSGEDLDSLKWLPDIPVKKVITIENLTTFFRWKESESILIYLGGYHNAVRRAFLQKIYKAFPDAQYLHFGDIDVGGFEIYRNLCHRTGIPFSPYMMGISQLKQYKTYGKKLTANDRRRLEILLKNEKYKEVWPTLEYMKEQDIKLEQESLQYPFR